MTDRSPSSQDATLTRVRNNQRRCRARRRDYIQELESRLHSCESTGIEPDTKTYQKTVDKLVHENRRLRELLDQVGVSEDSVKSHLGEHDLVRASSGLSTATDMNKVQDAELEATLDGKATQSMPDGEKTCGVSSFDCFLDASFPDLAEASLPSHSSELASLPNHSSTLPTVEDMETINLDLYTSTPSTELPSESTDISNDWSLPPFCFVPGDLENAEPVKECDSTLCTVAYDMIRQQNKRGVDMIEIGIRLWNGFIKGENDEEGCKVKNDLLFSVLEDIKG